MKPVSYRKRTRSRPGDRPGDTTIEKSGIPAVLLNMLILNGIESKETIAKGQRGTDHVPVVALSSRDGTYRLLVSEIDPDCLNSAFGIMDNSDGKPQLGYFDMDDLFDPEMGYNFGVVKYTGGEKISDLFKRASEKGILEL